LKGIAWNQRFGIQAWLESSFGVPFMILQVLSLFMLSAVGQRCQLCILLGSRRGRYSGDGAVAAHPPSSIPFLALGAWILAVGWFGFNVMSAQTLDKMNGLVAMNSLMAMVGGTLGRGCYG
jgi:ammonium transporter, Amt family